MLNVSPKTAAGTGGAALGGSLAIVFLWALNAIFPHVVITNEVASSWVVIFSAICTFVSSYSVHSSYIPSQPTPPQPNPPPN